MQAKFGGKSMQGIGSSGGESSGPSSGLEGMFGMLSSTVSMAANTATSVIKDGDIGHKVNAGWSTISSKVRHEGFLLDSMSTFLAE